MAVELNPGTTRRIAALFPESQRTEVARLLLAGYGNNLPYGESLGAAGLERVWFAVLKISEGSLERLRAALEAAETDWRDVLVAAGFASDVTAHTRWLAD